MNKAYSKVNLILKVIKRRADEKKHKIDSLMVIYTDLYDEIEIKESNKLTINYTQKNKPLEIKDCNILKSIKYFSKLINRDINVSINVIKNIPIGSGLGGSSTDAAFVINWIIKKYKVKVTKELLKDIALNLGSDIPFFMSNYKTARVSNYGDVVNKVDELPIKFKVHLDLFDEVEFTSTKAYHYFDMYGTSAVDYDKALKGLLNKDKSITYNDLQKPIFDHYQGKFFERTVPISAIIGWHYSDKTVNSNNIIILSGSGSSLLEII